MSNLISNTLARVKSTFDENSLPSTGAGSRLCVGSEVSNVRRVSCRRPVAGRAPEKPENYILEENY